MAYLIGTDEAGYGPVLGPLVVAAAVWQVPDDCPPEDLPRRLAGTVSGDARDRSQTPVVLADSKQLYSGNGSLAGLERGVFAFARQAGFRFRTLEECFAALAPDDAADRLSAPWNRGFDLPLPLDLPDDVLERLDAALGPALAAAGVRPLVLRCRVLEPASFNRLCGEYGNKAALLTEVTLDLVRRLLASLPPAPAIVVADKHGGRNRYAAAVERHFSPGQLVAVLHEGRRESVYRAGLPETRIELRFRSGGEAILPTALASMAAKYLRELSMRAFNAYWQTRLPGLRPTAGYYVDAQRFLGEIALRLAPMDLPDKILRRQR